MNWTSIWQVKRKRSSLACCSISGGFISSILANVLAKRNTSRPSNLQLNINNMFFLFYCKLLDGCLCVFSIILFKWCTCLVMHYSPIVLKLPISLLSDWDRDTHSSYTLQLPAHPFSLSACPTVERVNQFLKLLHRRWLDRKINFLNSSTLLHYFHQRKQQITTQSEWNVFLCSDRWLRWVLWISL